MSESRRIARLLAALPGGPVVTQVGNGDDAAVLRTPATVVSTDACVEGVHFERTFAPFDRIAERALHAAASDLAAMGARPIACVVALGLPEGFDEHDFDAIVDGLARGGAALGMPVVGGNLTRARDVSFTTTVLGSPHGTPLTRDGARAGDALHLTGPVGRAGAGLARLLAGSPTHRAAEAWRGVRARVDVAAHVASIAHACIDVSDGLGLDLSRMLSASSAARGVALGASLDGDALLAQARLDELGVDDPAAALRLCLDAGEDYELLYAADASTATEPTCIGRVIEGAGIEVRVGGVVQAVRARGFDHFPPR